jgi:Flp pilus assembly protein TadG
MRRAKNRKGIFVVLFGILFMSLMAAAAMSIDFARVWAMRNELQTSADAAALAGAVQLSTPGKNTDPEVQAEAYRVGLANLAMGVVPGIDNVTLGKWDDLATPQTFTTGVPPFNAVSVTVSHSTRGLIMGALGVTAPTVHAKAIAWTDAPISNANCIRPWAIPYEVLMGKINPLRTDDISISGSPYTRENLTRPFDQTRDLAILRSADPSLRTFSLKLGQNDNNKTTVEDGTIVNGQPGNFQAVVLPKIWDFTTQSPTIPKPNGGGSEYADAIMGKNCYKLSVGDSLATESGNMVGKTVNATDMQNNQTAPYGVCTSIVNDKSSPLNGNCNNAQGGVGVPIKAAFYYCPSACGGKSTVAVKLLGSFTLKKIYPNGDTGNTPAWDKSQIVGTFDPIDDSGPVGGSASLLYKIILVK